MEALLTSAALSLKTDIFFLFAVVKPGERETLESSGTSQMSGNTRRTWVQRQVRGLLLQNSCQGGQTLSSHGIGGHELRGIDTSTFLSKCPRRLPSVWGYICSRRVEWVQAGFLFLQANVITYTLSLHCLPTKHWMDVGLKEVAEKLRPTVWLYGRVELYVNTTWKQFGFNFPVDALFAYVFLSAVYSASDFLLDNIVCL